MGGCRCSYKNCTNTTKAADNIHFFHYPVKHRERCVQWIENACKPNFFDLEEEQLRNKVVCAEHFESSWFLNNQRKRLLQGAVPTLDGNSSNRASNEDNFQSAISMETDSPVFLPSNQYNDVKVVPANDDGTVFVLDTENMFTISPKIQSYIIKNGTLVPTNTNIPVHSTSGRIAKQVKVNRFTKPSLTSGYVMVAQNEIANINTPPGPSKPLIKEQQYCSKKVIKKELSNTADNTPEESQTLENDTFSNAETMEISQNIQQPEEKKVFPTAVSRFSSQQSKTKIVATNYLRQIKQHSRDIATIKRMLKQKKILEPPKPDIKTILNELKSQLPSTLITVISLLLGEKNELNEEDVEFFTSLHKGSPDVYQMLSDKYKWNLPSVDIVEAPSE